MTLDGLSTPIDAAGAPEFYLMEFADPTLWVPVTKATIVWLASAIASDRPFSLRQAPSQGTGSLTIKPTDRDIGTMIETKGHFLWEISRQEARQCHAALLSLGESEHPAHQYFDPGTNETDRQIVVSLGEYGRLP
jgi:hypothetical protein